MKPLKLIACLVTLHIVGSITLLAADAQAFREWSDVNGRKMTARLLGVLTPQLIKIERDDGQVFTVTINTFSEADKTYVKTYQAEEAERLASLPKFDENGLADASKDTWKFLLACGSQPASFYHETPLSDILKEMNQRMRVSKYKTPEGQALQFRTEPAALAEQLQISGQVPSMSTSDFLKRLAYTNKLRVKMDREGVVVLVSEDSSSIGTFFGTPVK